MTLVEAEPKSDGRSKVERKVMEPGDVDARGGGMIRVGIREGSERRWIVEVDVPNKSDGECRER